MNFSGFFKTNPILIQFHNDIDAFLVEEANIKIIEDLLYSDDVESQKQVFSFLTYNTKKKRDVYLPDGRYFHTINLSHFDADFFHRNMERIYEILFKFEQFNVFSRIVNTTKVLPSQGLIDKICTELLEKDESLQISDIIESTRMVPNLKRSLIQEKERRYRNWDVPVEVDHWFYEMLRLLKKLEDEKKKR